MIPAAVIQQAMEAEYGSDALLDLVESLCDQVDRGELAGEAVDALVLQRQQQWLDDLARQYPVTAVATTVGDEDCVHIPIQWTPIERILEMGSLSEALAIVDSVSTAELEKERGTLEKEAAHVMSQIAELQEELATLKARHKLLDTLVKVQQRRQKYGSKVKGQTRGPGRERGRLAQILQYIVDHGPQLPKAIADGLGISASAVSSLINSRKECFERTEAGWNVSDAGMQALTGVVA